MNDPELFELCKEVYERFPSWQVEESRFFANDYGEIQLLWSAEILPPTFAVCPLYTSDYLLEKLPKELHKDGIIYYLSLSAKYGDEFKSNYVSPSGYLYLFLEPESDTPLKTLLKLVIALGDAGEFKS
jgi:hypothetical protein